MTPRWLGLALYAEGASDHRFLDELLRRAVEREVNDRGRVTEVSSIQRLAPGSEAISREERIAEGAEAIQGAFHLLFVHADGNGDAQRARAERVDPGLLGALTRLGANGRAGVAVVPVRAMEVWAMADYEILREVLATRLTPEQLGLPNGTVALEGVTDPKQLLADAVKAARPRRRGRKQASAVDYLDLLGQRVRLPELELLPAFAQFAADLRAALTALGVREADA